MSSKSSTVIIYLDILTYCKFYTCKQVSMNGFVSFDRSYFGSATKPLYTSRNAPIIAPFFADADSRFATSSRIYISQYSAFNPSALTPEILRNATDEINRYQSYIRNNPSNTNNKYGIFNQIVQDFNATNAVVVTWDKLVPYPSETTANNNITNTFQLVLTSNGANLFAAFIYKDKGMNWWKRYKFTKAQAGYSNGTLQYSYELPNSFNSQILRIDSAIGNYGRKGRWLYRIDDSSINQINYYSNCQAWFASEPSPSIYLDAIRRLPCPCSIFQAIRDRRFRLNIFTFCAQSRFSRRANNGLRVRQQCCYSSRRRSFGSLLTSYPFGRSFSFTTASQQVKNEQALTSCCMKSSLCTLYSAKRPINRCVGYRPPRRAWFWGDPHVMTLDGKQYTFNGLGEYVLLQSAINNFALQGRTMKAIKTGNLSASATVFSAFAASEEGAVIVQFTLNATLNGIDILVNRTTTFSKHTLPVNDTKEYTNVDITRTSNKSVTATFSSGISIEVTLLTQMLSIAFNGPEEIKGSTTGLLGTWNDNINDDFKRPDGTYLPINSTESQIFYNFGQLWMVNTTSSLFTYPNGQTANDYKDPNFVPVFSDNIPALFGNNTAFYDQAVAQCGNNNECLFDAALTLNLEAAISSKDVAQQYQEVTNELENYPPQITGLTTYNVTYGTIFTTVLNINDSNEGDTVTVQLIDPPKNANFDNQTYTFTWNVTTYQNISFKFVATDSKGATSELIPQIIMCYCANSGSCDYTAEMVNINNIDQVECLCNSAWTGIHCTEDVDACADQPCFGNVTCNDNIAPQSGYTCGKCPMGYTGDGLKCSDIDECVNGTHQCNHTCINEDGSYSCQCRSGYMLNADKKGCTDINECTTGSYNCSESATCINQPGSYICMCNPGYTGDSQTCSDLNECTYNNGNCSQVCNNNVGSYTCSCNTGYELSNDKYSCVDVNECQRLRPCDQECINTVGSYYCQCNDGFHLDSNGVTCNVTDPCGPGHTCSQICTITNGSEICSCMKGYEIVSSNTSFCQDIDECQLVPSPCNQTCINSDGSYECSCMNGYRLDSNGWTCLDINECLNTTLCSSNAICINIPGSYSCQCKAGYTGNGAACSDINECSLPSNNCSPNAICRNTDGSYNCSCKTGFVGSGTVCQDIDECSSNTQCSTNAACYNTPGSYTCQCNPGYTGNGKICNDINECATGVNMCSTNANCYNNNGSYTCMCRSGYTGDGFNCKDINECTINDQCNGANGCTPITPKCSINANCSNTDGSYVCTCRQGYEGNGFTCHDINECDRNSLNNCPSNSYCTNTNGSYYCTCNIGYSGDKLTGCRDIDECSSNQNNCNSNADCINVVGSFACHCRAGYYGNGANCSKIETCTGNNCGNNAQCVLFDYSYYCSCKVGYYSNSVLPETQLQSGSHCQQGKVFNGSLMLNAAFNSELNNPSSAAFKTLQQEVTATLTATLQSSSVTKNSFERVVVTGFKAGSIIAEYYTVLKQNSNINQKQLADVISSSNYTIQGSPIQDVTVTDYDECASANDNNCNSNENCINEPGTYSCQCKTGYTGSSCVDINECMTTRPCGGNATCLNTDGSYTCTCLLGYQGDPYSARGCSIACNNDFCINGGTCTYNNNQRICRCPPNFTGIRCENTITPTAPKTTAPITTTVSTSATFSQGIIIAIAVGSISAILLIIIFILVCVIKKQQMKRRTSLVRRAETKQKLTADQAVGNDDDHANLEMARLPNSTDSVYQNGQSSENVFVTDTARITAEKQSNNISTNEKSGHINQAVDTADIEKQSKNINNDLGRDIDSTTSF